MMNTLFGSVSMMALLASDSISETFLELNNLSGWNATAGIGLDANAFISNSSANPTGAAYPYEIAANEVAIITAELTIPPGASSWALFGINVNPAGAAVVANSSYSAYIGASGTNAATFVGSSVGGNSQYVTGSSFSGKTIYITITVELDSVSLIARDPVTQFENLLVLNRATMTNGGIIKGISLFMMGNQGTSGARIGKIRARKAIQNFSTSTMFGQTYEGGIGHVMHQRQTDRFRLVVPHGVGTPSNPGTLIVYSHAAGHNEFDFYNKSEQSPLQQAVLDAGYMVAAAYGGGDSWSNATSLQDFVDLLAWVDNYWTVDKIVLIGASMGALTVLNIAQQGLYGSRLKGVYCVSGVCDMDTLYSSFSGSINSAWGVSNLSELQAAYVGSNPIDEPVEEFETGCGRYRFIHKNSDTVVNPITNSQAMQSKLSAGTFLENTIVNIAGGGHLTSDVFDPTDFLPFIERSIS